MIPIIFGQQGRNYDFSADVVTLFTTTAVTFQNVDDDSSDPLTVTLFCSGVNPVVVAVVPDGTGNNSYISAVHSGGTSAKAAVRLVEDVSGSATERGRHFIRTDDATSSIVFVPSSIFFCFVPSAGSHTWTLQCQADESGDQVELSRIKLFGIEL